MSSEEVAIRVRNVSKHYAMFARPEDRLKQMVMPRLQRLARRPPRRYFTDFAAVNDVSFDVKRGETVGIIGRNGSGKSTTLQMVCGTLQPTSGSIEVNGRIAALLELGAGFNPEFTGRENVYLNAAILGLSRSETDERFDDIARFADIGMFIDQPVKTYSSGMYVRLAFAVAINVDPDILVVDEALSVGDEAFQRKCFARIEDIRDKGGTILFVSHGAQTIIQLCDRAMLFDRGELLLEGQPKTVVGQYQRLANAPAEASDRIRAEIVHKVLGCAPTQGPTLAASETSADAYNEPQKIGDSSDAYNDTSWSSGFDPNFKSQSMIRLEELGARINHVRLVNTIGEEVNILRRGDRYQIEFDVDFAVDAFDVAFGFAIRTISGLTIAGAMSSGIRKRVLKRVAAGSHLHVRFTFDCHILPDAYFVGCAVYGRSSVSDDLMHRVVDAIAFRVAQEADLLPRGYFDLSPELSIESYAVADI